MTSRSALILGGTGLVGRELLSFLLREAEISSIVVLVRNARGLPADPRLIVQEVDFDHLERYGSAFKVDQIFCALGTTMRQAKTKERFRAVDHDYPVSAARLGRDAGAGHFLLVSALGANPASRIFYNRVKGETERDLAAVGFPSLTIARPSLLAGRRAEFRLGERLALLLGAVAPPSMRPIAAKDVAAALTLAARLRRLGHQILTARDMRGASVRLANP